MNKFTLDFVEPFELVEYIDQHLLQSQDQHFLL